MTSNQRTSAYATPEENDRIKVSISSQKELPSDTSFKLELIEQRRQNSLLTFKVKDQELDLRRQQEIIQSLREQLEQQASDAQIDHSKDEAAINQTAQKRVDDLTKEYKAKVKELKQEHNKKIKSLETHYEEAVRYVKRKEKERYDNQLNFYKETHTEDSVVKLQSSVEGMATKFFDMRAYAKELEKKIEAIEPEYEEKRTKEIQDRHQQELRLVREQERKKYDEMIKDYKERHSNQGLQAALNVMTQKYLDMKNLAGNAERKLFEMKEQAREDKRRKL